jgi:transposase
LASVYRRTLAILEFDQGRSVTQIAQLLKVSRQSVYNWIAAYAQERCPKALVAADRPGRPQRWTAEVEALLPRWLNQSPEIFGLSYS